MPSEPLDTLDRLFAEATPGEWKVVDDDPECEPCVSLGHYMLLDLHEADAALIVALHNAYPALSAVVRAARFAPHGPTCSSLRPALDVVRGGTKGVTANDPRWECPRKELGAALDALASPDAAPGRSVEGREANG